MNDLFNQRQEREKKIINYFCELLHRRDNKAAWSPWIWHICSENNTIISKGERSGENMRTRGLKCQWSIPVLISIAGDNTGRGGAHVYYCLKQKGRNSEPFPKKKKREIKSHILLWGSQLCKHAKAFTFFLRIVCFAVGEVRKPALQPPRNSVYARACVRVWERGGGERDSSWHLSWNFHLHFFDFFQVKQTFWNKAAR